MSTKKKSSNLYIIAGPNGAGKTTFAKEFLPHYARCENFVNADLIVAKGNGASLSVKTEQAMKRAFRRVLEEHKRLGRPVAIWRAGKVVRIPADRLSHKRQF